ncbi:MAG: hypothetical protein ACOCWT_03500 [Desulfohalobiaceae bacterium]
MSTDTANPRVAIIGIFIIGLLIALFYVNTITRQLHPSPTGHGASHAEESHDAPASGSSGHGSGHD